MIDFALEKKQCLEKVDRSRKGSIDSGVVSILDLINAQDDFYTTSSCAGRIMILERQGPKKHETVWHFATHDLVSFEQFVSEVTNAATGGGDVWLKFEPAILHVCCKTLEDAHKLIHIGNCAGFKHGGIVSSADRFIVQINGVDRLETVVAKEGNVLPDSEYLQILHATCAAKMDRNSERLKLLEKELVKGFEQKR